MKTFLLAAIGLLSAAMPLDARGTQDPNEPRPIAAADTVFIDEMTFMEVRDANRAGKTTVLSEPEVSNRTARIRQPASTTSCCA